MKKTIYFIRHGQTDFNLKGIVQGGGVDSDLNDTGRQQARAFHRHYHDTGFETVITSRLKRTRQTVEPFLEAGHPWEAYEEINEMNWGVHEGKASTPEMHQEWKAVIEAWEKGDYHARLEGGESAFELGERIRSFLSQLEQRPERTLLVCSHGRTMRGLVSIMNGLPLSEMNRFRHSNTGLYLVEWDTEQYHFRLENDLKHLAQLESKIRG